MTANIDIAASLSAFWELCENTQISMPEVGMYSYLLYEAATRSNTEVEVKTERLCKVLSTSKKMVGEVRMRLKDHGVLDFSPGVGGKSSPCYRLLIVTHSNHVVTQGNHVVTQGNYPLEKIVTHSNHIVTDSNHVVTHSNHIVTHSNHMVTQGNYRFPPIPLYSSYVLDKEEKEEEEPCSAVATHGESFSVREADEEESATQTGGSVAGEEGVRVFLHASAPLPPVPDRVPKRKPRAKSDKKSEPRVDPNKPDAVMVEGFREALELYPFTTHTSKGKSEKAYYAAVRLEQKRTGQTVEGAISVLRECIKTYAYLERDKEPKYIRSMQRWLEDEDWDILREKATSDSDDDGEDPADRYLRQVAAGVKMSLSAGF